MLNGKWNQEVLWDQLTLVIRKCSVVSYIENAVLNNFNASSYAVKLILNVWKVVETGILKDGKERKISLNKAMRAAAKADSPNPPIAKITWANLRNRAK